MSARLSPINSRLPRLVSALALLLLLANNAEAATPAAKKTTKKAKAKRAVSAAAVVPESPDPAPTVPAPAGSSAMAELKKYHVRMQKLMGKKVPDWSPEATARTAEVRQLVGEFLDFPELSKRSLAAHWDALPNAKRTAFVSTLRGLVERSYVDQMHGQANYEIKWDKETVTPAGATVLATLTTKRKGKPVVIALEYKLLHKKRGWVVYDVITDEQSLLETYRGEFTKIIRKESFDALLERLRKKLDEKSKLAASK